MLLGHGRRAATRHAAAAAAAAAQAAEGRQVGRQVVCIQQVGAALGAEGAGAAVLQMWGMRAVQCACWLGFAIHGPMH